MRRVSAGRPLLQDWQTSCTGISRPFSRSSHLAFLNTGRMGGLPCWANPPNVAGNPVIFDLYVSKILLVKPLYTYLRNELGPSYRSTRRRIPNMHICRTEVPTGLCWESFGSAEKYVRGARTPCRISRTSGTSKRQELTLVA